MEKKEIKVRCAHCSKEFITSRKTQRENFLLGKEVFCSQKCFQLLMKSRKRKAPCGYCGEVFTLSDKQRNNTNNNRGVFCSRDCFSKSRGFVPGGARRTTGICKSCGEYFESAHGNKHYCTIDCMLKDPAVINRVKKQQKGAVLARLKKLGVTDGSKPYHGVVKINCAHCGEEKKIKRSTRGKRNFCNSTCYRLFMAERFDRWIASPQRIALPQNYDEFLTQEVLPCLIEGCTWEGMGLTAHVNFEHGIQADEFKKMVGFNLKTGGVSPELAEILRGRAIDRDWGTGLKPNPGHKSYPAGRYRSLEGREHSRKASALLKNALSGKSLPCRTCMKSVPQGYFGQKLYCSTKCRSAYYLKKNRCHEVVCFHCGAEFIGSRDQKKRFDKNGQVFCSFRCRGHWASRGRKREKI
jgi:hypothetical protein